MVGELSDAGGLMPMYAPRLLRFALLVSAFALSGCASTRLIDSEVRSFRSGATELAAASYQFERLPSQQADAAAQTQRENWAAPVLQPSEKIGLHRCCSGFNACRSGAPLHSAIRRGYRTGAAQ